MTALTDAGFGPQPTPNDPRIWKGTVAEFFEDAADRIDAKNLADAIQQAIANPPKFYPGDRVRVTDRVPAFSLGTVESQDGERYKVRMDFGRFKSEPPDTVHESVLVRLDTCTCGPDCKAVEGELH